MFRHGADAVGRPAEPGRTGQPDTSSSAAVRHMTEVQSGIDRRSGGHRNAARDRYWCQRPQSGVEGTGCAINLPMRATRKAFECHDSRRHAGGIACALGVPGGRRMFRPGTPEVCSPQCHRRRGSGGWHRRNRALCIARLDGGRDVRRGPTGFDSKIWGDAEQMLRSVRRTSYSSLLFRLNDATAVRPGEAPIEPTRG